MSIDQDDLFPWKSELDAIVAARAQGRAESIPGLLKALDERYPNVPEISYQLAWSLDTAGSYQEALPYYEKAVALGLSTNELSGALIGLGTTLRNLGQYDRASEVLKLGQTRFPDHREFDVFLAFCLHDLGKHVEAMQLILTVLADTSEDTGITVYQRAIRFYADKLLSAART